MILLIRTESESTYNRYNVECKRPDRTLSNDYIIDEEKSVKWNREQVAIHNNAIKEEWKKYREAYFQGWVNFCSDLRQAISNEYGFSEDQVNCIMEELGSGDLHEVANKAQELCDFLTDFLSREGPKEVFHK